MSFQCFASFVLAAVAFTLPHSVEAKGYFNCDRLEVERSLLEKELSSDERLSSLVFIFTDMKDLMKSLMENSKVHPKSFLLSCLRSKQAIFDRHTAAADLSLRKNLEFNLMLGEYHYLAQRFKLAGSFFEQAVQFGPQDYRGYWWRLRSFVEDARQNPAEVNSETYGNDLEQLLLALANQLDVPVILRSEALQELGVLSLKLKRFRKAQEYFERLLQVEPSNQDAIAFLVQYYFDRKKNEKALQLVLKKLSYITAKTPENRRLLEIGLSLSQEIPIQKDLIAKRYKSLGFPSASPASE
ncbi:tetratricopeptide repeat protein [bacterium]|nr:tetratricopeptide repeat protein [bacterium]